MPGITGNIVAGALLGLTLFHEVEVAKALQPLSTFAICPDGVDFDAPDGLPVKLIVLIVTPEEHEKHHIEVLASLSAMISDTHVSARLMAAEDPNEAWEVIESRESRPYNYFLEDDENGQGQPIRAATPPSTL